MSKTFTENIQKIMRRQEAKGLEKYGHDISKWDAGIVEGLENLEEELVDALYYIEFAKSHLQLPTAAVALGALKMSAPEAVKAMVMRQILGESNENAFTVLYKQLCNNLMQYVENNGGFDSPVKYCLITRYYKASGAPKNTHEMYVFLAAIQRRENDIIPAFMGLSFGDASLAIGAMRTIINPFLSEHQEFTRKLLNAELGWNPEGTQRAVECEKCGHLILKGEMCPYCELEEAKKRGTESWISE